MQDFRMIFLKNRYSGDVMTNSNANIDRAAATAFAATTAFGSVLVTPALAAAIRFARWVNSALNDGRSRLSLNLGHRPRDCFLRHNRGCNRHCGGRGDLHGFLQTRFIQRLPQIVSKYHKKIINQSMVKWAQDKLLICSRFSLVGDTTEWQSQCAAARTA